ncbi:MAG: hypothetical protein ACE5JI_13945 [Acidobacteriota bacterium]
MEAVKEFSADHEKHFKEAMDELVASGVDDAFVIFETDEGKFLQFSFSRGEGLTFDLPRMGLSADERRRVAEVEGMETMDETEISYLVQIGTDTRMGALLAHRVFREVFLCPKDYRVEATLEG